MSPTAYTPGSPVWQYPTLSITRHLPPSPPQKQKLHAFARLHGLCPAADFTLRAGRLAAPPDVVREGRCRVAAFMRANQLRCDVSAHRWQEWVELAGAIEDGVEAHGEAAWAEVDVLQVGGPCR